MIPLWSRKLCGIGDEVMSKAGTGKREVYEWHILVKNMFQRYMTEAHLNEASVRNERSLTEANVSEKRLREVKKR